jgi:membrane protein YqaA with SNARE-associated domain
MGLGAPGLFLLAFVDSSVLALPEVVDILIVWMVIAQPDRWLLYGVMATAGSVAGCYVLYALARRGGEVFLRKRLRAAHIDRAMSLFQRYGVLSLVVPSVMPPPVPFKPFIIMAGVAGMPRVRFLASITAGRAIRYVGEALLALWYGQQALTYLHENGGRVAAVTLALATAGGLIYYAYRKLSPTR